MRIAVLAPCLLVSLAACGDDDTHTDTVTPDAPQTRVSGCEDPAVWTLPALVATTAEAQLGGGECGAPQLPLHRATVVWQEDYTFQAEQHQVVDRVCWRVTEASPGSGWTAGQVWSADGWFAGSSLNVIGFSRPVTVEGRGLFPDGTVAYSIAPTTIELAPPMILAHDAVSVTAVMGPNGWAEDDTVHVWGQRIPTEKVLGGAVLRTIDGFELGEITLHQVGPNIVLRTWTHPNNQVEYTDFVVGPGTRGQITTWGNAVLVDGTKLVILEREISGGLIVKRQVTLPAEPLEIVGGPGSVLFHLPGTLMRVGIYDGTTDTLAVGDGALVSGTRWISASYFDGTTFRRIQPPLQLELDPVGFTPPAQDLARLGKPTAAVDGMIIGENGLLALDPSHDDIAPGPASASYADVFGDGHLGPLSADTATYVIEHDNGSAELYQAPYTDYCNPI